MKITVTIDDENDQQWKVKRTVLGNTWSIDSLRSETNRWIHNLQQPELPGLLDGGLLDGEDTDAA